MHTGVLEQKDSAVDDSTAVAGRIEEFEEQFSQLHRQLVEELIVCSIPVNTLVEALMSLPLLLRKEYENSITSRLPDLRKGSTTKDVMFHLNPLMNFMDYGLLAHLIHKFGSAGLKENMSSYESDI